MEIANDIRCERYTGADLASLIREAGIQALTELISNPLVVPEVSQRHVNAAFNKVRPSVHEKVNSKLNTITLSKKKHYLWNTNQTKP